ncbi:hypothetical protein EVAR_46382_1 [Eumeta japonica]|uniref:Uncharacterized protein n=1 Tax=Eumeta variegata TaxID=151549 RepID=A0A4C1WYG9_EUMVA|nr:hypothetical protein EVAR_46382_1 [Eumeta japonica]
MEAPHKKSGPGQCHRCQLYSLAAANCRADPRCVKYLVPHWTRESNSNRPKNGPAAPPWDLINFPDLAGNKSTPSVTTSRPASTPANPWVKTMLTMSSRAAPGPPREADRRAPPVSPPVSATAGTSSFGDDIQTVMAILRACRNVEEKLSVLVKYYHLMVKLESI